MSHLLNEGSGIFSESENNTRPDLRTKPGAGCSTKRNNLICQHPFCDGRRATSSPPRSWSTSRNFLPWHTTHPWPPRASILCHSVTVHAYHGRTLVVHWRQLDISTYRIRDCMNVPPLRAYCTTRLIGLAWIAAAFDSMYLRVWNWHFYIGLHLLP